jgi:o-succinylbenzoate synthase
MKATFVEHTFYFDFPAYTSRGVLHEKKVWFIILHDSQKYYVGECSPLVGLSRDKLDTMSEMLSQVCSKINNNENPFDSSLDAFPSIRFGLESAWLQANMQQEGILFPTNFIKGEDGIPTNGLIWAGERDYVLQQIDSKISMGFPCIKMKIGAQPFNEDVKTLSLVRSKYPSTEIRLDANGAFSPEEALNKLNILSQFNIHSIEQPIAAHQKPAMKKLCEQSPIPIALDEELIDITNAEEKELLLKNLHPQYIILKPTLLGGFNAAEEWILLAKNYNIDWWITSALESNVGLNAIAQWTYKVKPDKTHGLGTGLIYSNNIPSPLRIKEGKLFYLPQVSWNFSSFIGKNIFL